ncbi:hypothetical protein [Pelistega suis]|uniref:Uncharacterized protein n=1 Tax=Pelistega suis TaxID=1631957 RepID=A0A849P7V0_9BURK|nr:hypothetical protein [Pelistega suis]NOL51618.1 hypothetical protein [Pelistega suis]
MLKVSFIHNENYFKLKDQLESLFNSQLKHKYKIMDNPDVYPSVDIFLENELCNVKNGKYSSVLIFIDEDILIPEELKYVYLFHQLNPPYKGCDKVAGNRVYLQQQISFGLKRINFIRSNFNDKMIRSILIMPRRNFSSSTLEQLFRTIIEIKRNKGNEHTNQIQRLFYEFIDQHKKPKSKSDNANIKYMRDDNDVFFRLGEEKHGQAETKQPPHDNDCILSSYFRFGVRLNRDIHFNVSSSDAYIATSSKFWNCHRKPYWVKKNTSHLNIFPNDFIR